MGFFHELHTWVLISFLICAIILFKAGYKTIITLLDTRIAAIRDDIETARKLRAEAETILAEYKQKQQDAAQEAEEIVVGARIAAENIRKDAEKDLEDMIARKESLLGARLARMEETAKAEIQAYAANLAVKATAEIIATRLDKAANDRLVEVSTKEISKNLL